MEYENSIGYFDAVYCICMEDRQEKKELLLKQFDYFFPGFKLNIFPAINTRHLDNHYIGCTLSHRSVIQEAKDKQYKNILVFEEDAILHKNFDEQLALNIEELKKVEWDIFYLGACVWETPSQRRHYPFYQDCKLLKKITGATCTQALAYNMKIYDFILQEWPKDIEGMKIWCEENHALDQWLAHPVQHQKKCVISTPRLCTQPFLLWDDKQDHPKDFIDVNDFGVKWP